ncbi:MAG TPA: TetR/AcrR family transcriptional regulator [Deltaproteobacteria bacterium]|nr:TetR/AcrR family transcriptional regulator [Deltaproteobacteria bacterium]
MPGAKKTFLRLDQEKQQKILAAAIDEFATWGFHRASINRLVQALGIAKGSIFQYFGNKEGLFSYIFDYAIDRVKVSLKRVRRDTENLDFYSRIRASLLEGISFIDRHPKLYRIYLKMVFQEDFPARERYLKKIRLFSVDYLKPLIETGINRGEIHSDLDPNIAAFMLDAIFDRFMQAYAVPFFDSGSNIHGAKHEEIRTMIDQIIEILKLGFGSEE